MILNQAGSSSKNIDGLNFLNDIKDAELQAPVIPFLI